MLGPQRTQGKPVWLTEVRSLPHLGVKRSHLLDCLGMGQRVHIVAHIMKWQRTKLYLLNLSKKQRAHEGSQCVQIIAKRLMYPCILHVLSPVSKGGRSRSSTALRLHPSVCSQRRHKAELGSALGGGSLVSHEYKGRCSLLIEKFQWDDFCFFFFFLKCGFFQFTC